jgi:hypothetical protein
VHTDVNATISHTVGGARDSLIGGRAFRSIVRGRFKEIPRKLLIK